MNPSTALNSEIGMVTDHELRMEALRLYEENAALRATLAVIVDTAGGFVERQPTSAINILQRIRELISTRHPSGF
jgi:hypothetical protein